MIISLSNISYYLIHICNNKHKCSKQVLLIYDFYYQYKDTTPSCLWHEEMQ